jgi:hypothetical protein
MVKKEFHFFVLFLKGIQTKIFTFKDFLHFFYSAHFASFKVDQIFWRLSLEYEKLRSVEIFRIFMVPEI